MLMGMVLRTTQHTMACTLHQTYVYLLGMVMTWYFHGIILRCIIKALNLFGSSIKSRMRQREIRTM